MTFRMPGRRTLIGLGLAALTLAVYAQAYREGFLPVDDSLYVGDNPHVQAGLTWAGVYWAFTTTTAANWHPVTWLSHMMDCQFFGLHIGAHHLVNVFFHLLTVLLVFWVFESMTGATGRSAFLAAVFALHPLHVESVAWISERKDVLSALFWLLTMTAYVAYVRKRSVSRYLLVLLPFILGLMAKPMLVTLPCALLLMDYWPLGRLNAVARTVRPRGKTSQGGLTARPTLLGLIVEKAPMFALAGLSSVITFYAQRSLGAVQTIDMLPLRERLANAVVAYATYMFHTVWPIGLSTFYALPDGGYSWTRIGGPVAVLAGMSALALWNVRRRPWLAVGWFWFAGTLVPVIGLVQVGAQAMADRYMYIPLLGLTIMAAWSVPAFFSKTRYRGAALAAAAASFLMFLGSLCWIQASYWRDNLRLYSHEAALEPNSPFAHAQLGRALKDAGRIDEAQREYLRTVEIAPTQIEANMRLGVIAFEKKQYDEAIRYFSFAVDHASGNLNWGSAEIDLAIALAATGKLEDAAKHYEAGLALDPENIRGHSGLADTLARLGRPDEAAEHCRACLRLQPDNAAAQAQLGKVLAAAPKRPLSKAHESEPKPKLETPDDYYRYGNQLADQNRFTEAAEQYQAALALNPNLVEVRVNLGNTFAARAKPREALAEFQAALAIQPNNASALTNAGNALVQLNQFSKALDMFDQSLRINPRQPDAYYGRGLAFAGLNEPEKAAQAYKKALALNPANRFAREGLERLRVAN